MQELQSLTFREQLVISVLDFAMLDRTCIQKMERLQGRDIISVGYSTGTLVEMCWTNGGSAILHLVGDNLETFGRNQGSEQLGIGAEGTENERLAKAFKAVIQSRSWQGKYHLVIAPSRLDNMTRSDLGIEDTGSLCRLGNGAADWIASTLGMIEHAVGLEKEAIEEV